MSLEQGCLDTYSSLFINREDVYSLQTANGSYFLKRSPVTNEVIQSHLLGEVTAGWYALSPKNTVKWVALDADRPDGMEQLQQAWRDLQERKISAYLESSRRGGHLWVLFNPISAKAARHLILGSVTDLEGIEVYPKRDTLDRGVQVGNLVRGPLGIHRLTGQRYPFLDPISLNPVSRSVVGTLGFLQEAEKVSAELVAEQLAVMLDQAQPLKEDQKPKVRTGTLSPISKLKEQIGDTYNFISKYVELDDQGRGHCPFHPPDHNPSFAVDRARGFWVCFHEVNPKTGRYIGGDAIAFYRRLTGLSYSEVLAQLQAELREDELTS
jgi:hypothetical protein